MAFQEIASLDADVTIALGGRNKKTNKDNPKSVEGYYLGSKEVRSPKSKTGFASIHILQTAKGNVGVWGKTDMDRKIKSVTPGTMIRVTHTGMQATPNGEMYKYSVEQDADNTIDVGNLANVQTAATGQGEYEADGGTADEGLSAEDQEELLQAQAEAEARAAKVKALLNKTKRA